MAAASGAGSGGVAAAVAGPSGSGGGAGVADGCSTAVSALAGPFSKSIALMPLTVRAWVPVEELALVIGDRGAGVAELERATSTTCHIPVVDQSCPWAEVSFSGSARGCAEAVDSVVGLVDEIDDVIVSFRTVPQRLKAVRSSVPKVSADTNVRIFVAEDDGDDAPIELEGTYSAAFKAFTLLQVGLYRLATAFKRATVAVPADKVGVVIGAAGRSVREIMASTKAKVSLRASEGGDQARRRAAQVAVVHGPADSVLLACDTIERMVAGASLADALEATRSGLGQVLGWQAVLSRKGRGKGGRGEGSKGQSRNSSRSGDSRRGGQGSRGRSNKRRGGRRGGRGGKGSRAGPRT